MQTLETRLCDACGVAEAVYSVQTWEGPLVLCGHHEYQHGAAILAAGFAIAKLRGTPIDRVWDPSMVRVGPSQEWL